jgi:putative aldouronate transport system substrate-binding protein
MMSGQQWSRRSVLFGGAALAAIAAAGCGSSSSDEGGTSGPSTDTGSTSTTAAPTTSGPTSGSPSGSASAVSSSGGGATSVFPAYGPFEGLTPDLPGNKDGLPPAFLEYPTEPISYAKTPVGTGDTISVFTYANGTSPGRDKSPWWQNLESVLGIKLDMNAVTYKDYASKRATLFAGNDIPDIFILDPSGTDIAAVHKFFEPMGPYLSGDAVKEYPALAAFNPQSWKTPMVDGELFGVPEPRIPTFYATIVRQDILDQLGIGKPDLKKGDDLLALFKELTRPNEHHWAYAQQPMWLVRAVWQMFGVPNGTNAWSEKDGKFTSQFEAEQTKQVLDIVAGVWKAGYMNPDSGQPSASWAVDGTALTYINNFSGFTGAQQANPTITIDFLPLPKWDGGGLPATQVGPAATSSFAVFKKAKEDRIRELLRFANYIAAPVGTAEYLNVHYGKAGVSYARDGASITQTDAGKADIFNVNSLEYVSGATFSAFYLPGLADFVKKEYNYAKQTLASTNSSAELGLYSATYPSPAGFTAATNIQNAIDDILFNRKPVSSWDDALKKWQNAAGNKMRADYEAAYAKLH